MDRSVAVLLALLAIIAGASATEDPGAEQGLRLAWLISAFQGQNGRAEARVCAGLAGVERGARGAVGGQTHRTFRHG